MNNWLKFNLVNESFVGLKSFATNLTQSTCLTAQALLLAFQHYIVNLGTTVLIASTIVPRMGGDHVCFYDPYKIISTQKFLIEFCLLISLSSVCYEQGDKARVIQALLFMSGINTLLQTLIGSRLPTVMGASFAYTLPLLSIINDYTDEAFTSEHDVCKL